MTNGPAEGLLYLPDERKDGELRDPVHPLRPAKGNFIVPRSVIRDQQLRPGLLLKGQPRGRVLDRFEGVQWVGAHAPSTSRL